MRLKNGTESIALLLGMGVASTTLAASETNSSSTTLNEVVVTAQKREQNLQQTPISITAVDKQALQDQGVHDISDISTSTPNVEIAPSPGGSTGATVAIRGASMINPAITWEPAVGIYVDGVFVAKNMGGLFDVADLDRIEVLRGPQGTLYGKNTTGGAINLVTRKPADKTGATARLTSGNFGYKEIAANADSGKIGENARFSVAVNKRERDGFYDNLSAAPGAASEFKQLDSTAARLAGLFTLSKKLDLEYTFDISDKDNTPAFGQYEFPATFSPVTLPDPQRAKQGDLDGAKYEKSRSSGHAVTINYEASQALKIKSISAYRELSFDDANDYDGTGALGFNTERHIDQDQTSQEFQFLGQAGRVNYVTGLYYFNDHADTTNPFTIPTPAPLEIPHHYGVDSTSYAAFGQADVQLNQAWTVTAGARYTTEHKEAFLQAPFAGIDVAPEKSWNNFSPMAALSYAVTSNINTYAKISRGWKAGGFNAEAGTTADAVKPYDEETLTAYETGVKSRWLNDRIQVNLAVFQNNVDDLQVSAWDTSINASRVSNAGNARVTGTELETLFAMTEGLKGFVNYGYLDTEYLDFIDPVSGTQLRDSAKFAYSPRNKFAAGFDYMHDLNMAVLRARVDYAFTDTQYFYYDAYSAAVTASKSYALLNARIALSDIEVGKKGQSMELGLWGKNLTDAEYRLNGIPTSTGGAVNYYGDPRTVGIDAIYNF